jgi:hypothetical protein
MPRAAVGLCAAALLGWVAYRVGRRSARLGNGVLATILVASLLPTLFAWKAKTEQRTFWRKMATELQGVKDPAKTIEAMQRMRDTLRKPEAQVVASLLEAFTDFASRFGAFRAAVEKLADAGGARASTIRSRTQIRERRELLAAVTVAFDEAAQAYDKMPDRLRARLSLLHGNATARQMERHIEQDKISDLAVRWFGVRRQVLRDHEVQLALLERAWGEWSWSEAGQAIVCRDTATVQAYSRINEELQQLMGERATLEEQIEALRKR